MMVGVVRKQRGEEDERQEDVRVLWIEDEGENSIGGAVDRVCCDKWTFGGAKMQVMND